MRACLACRPGARRSAAVPTVTALDGAPAEGYLIDLVPARPPSLSRDTMAFSAVTAAVRSARRSRRPARPRVVRFVARVPVAARLALDVGVRLARRAAMSGAGSLALRLSWKTPGAAVRASPVAARAMAKDEDSTAESCEGARTSQACKTLVEEFHGAHPLHRLRGDPAFSFLFKGITKVRVRSSRSPRRSPRRARPKSVVHSPRSDSSIRSSTPNVRPPTRASTSSSSASSPPTSPPSGPSASASSANKLRKAVDQLDLVPPRTEVVGSSPPGWR